jgi:hypothetical protein
MAAITKGRSGSFGSSFQHQQQSQLSREVSGAGSSSAGFTREELMDLEFEESWNSLASFNMTQRGRLSVAAADGEHNCKD